MTKKKRNVKIEVTFSSDDNELDLYHRIIINSKLLTKSGWMKEAALEKLEREENHQYDGYHTMINHRQNIDDKNKTDYDLPISFNAIDNLLDSIK